MFYIYIIYSNTSDRFYVGHSRDPWKRLAQHNTSDDNTYTSKHRPWRLKAIFQTGRERKTALKLEMYIKKQKSRKLIERLIDVNFIPEDKLAQLVRVPHLRD